MAGLRDFVRDSALAMPSPWLTQPFASQALWLPSNKRLPDWSQGVLDQSLGSDSAVFAVSHWSGFRAYVQVTHASLSHSPAIGEIFVSPT